MLFHNYFVDAEDEKEALEKIERDLQIGFEAQTFSVGYVLQTVEEEF